VTIELQLININNDNNNNNNNSNSYNIMQNMVLGYYSGADPILRNFRNE